MREDRNQWGGKTPGELPISGAKNSCLSLMPLALLSGKEIKLKNVPVLSDVDTMKILLESLGCKVSFEKSQKLINLKLDKEDLFLAEYEIVNKMRASILVLGPLLARYGRAIVALPGGCAIGARPVNLHLMALKALGASFIIDKGYIKANVSGKLKGAEISFPFKSVGATINAIIAATLAKGTSKLVNVAEEPEIIDLCMCLRSMGCKLEGEGTSTIVIEGVNELSETTHEVVMDRIELGTYMIASAITDGDIKLTGGNIGLLKSFIEKLTEVGVEIIEGKDFLRVRRKKNFELKSINITTEPYPGFPTDLQAQVMALLSVVNGVSSIEEKFLKNGSCMFLNLSEWEPILRLAAGKLRFLVLTNLREHL